MKFFYALACLAALAPSLVGALEPTRTEVARDLGAGAFTNAQRLARGLPLKKPLNRARDLRAAKRSIPSDTPVPTYRGYIQVTEDGVPRGYLTPILSNEKYAYGSLTSSKSDALFVSFATRDGSQPFDIRALNGYVATTTFPFFGGIANLPNSEDGFDHDSIYPNSFNSVALISVASTPTGAEPQFGEKNSLTEYKFHFSTRSYESAIWVWDTVTSKLTVHWVNRGGDSVPNVIARNQAANDPNNGDLVVAGNLDKCKVGGIRGAGCHTDAPVVELVFVPE